MHRHALRFVLSVSLLLTGRAFSAQTPAPTDIYEHFIGTWVGSGVYIKDGARHEVPVTLTITESNKKDRLQLDYVYGQKGTPDFERTTRFLKLNPSRAKFELAWKGSSNQTYEATGLDEFAKAGLGKFAGITEDEDWEPLERQAEQQQIYRVAFDLSTDTLRYRWELGTDQTHLKILSTYTFSRSTAGSK